MQRAGLCSFVCRLCLLVGQPVCSRSICVFHVSMDIRVCVCVRAQHQDNKTGAAARPEEKVPAYW